MKARDEVWGQLVDRHNRSVMFRHAAAELRRWLAKQGCTLESHKGGSGHLIVIRGDRRSQLPMHGSRKELGTGLVSKIKRDLGLD
jgi:mRNA interferase HicA